MKLHQAFEIVKGDVVAFSGAGGKTATLVSLGYELLELGWRVLATITTTLDEDQLSLFPLTMPFQEGSAAISAALNTHGFILLYDKVRGGKVHGLDPDRLTALLDMIDSDILLIEADQSQGMPFKAPYPDEPLIPSATTLVVPMVSLGALGKPLDEAHVYNPQAMIEKFGFYEGGKIRLPWLAQVLRDDELGLRGIPPQARITAFINQTPPSGYLKGRARAAAKMMLKSPRLHGVALGSVRAVDPIAEVQRPVGAVVLAAGQSSRMGQPKVLLPWTDGKTIIEHIIQQLILAKVDEIVVVTGFYAEAVREVVKPLGVRIAHNRAHKTGEMLSSLQTGLKALSESMAATLVVLGDQPRIQPKTVYRILKAYAEGAGQLIIPSYQMQRGHPLLIGRRYWQEFLALDKNSSPREVVNAHQDEITYIVVDNDSVLQDVDTPNDYRVARRQAGLEEYDLTKRD